MAFDEMFSFNKENQVDYVEVPTTEEHTVVEEHIQVPEVVIGEAIAEETVIEEPPFQEQVAEPTLESMLSIDPGSIPVPVEDGKTLESQLEAIVGELIPIEEEKKGGGCVPVEDEINPSDFASASEEPEQVHFSSQEIEYTTEEVIEESQDDSNELIVESQNESQDFVPETHELNLENYEIIDGPIDSAAIEPTPLDSVPDEENMVNLVPVDDAGQELFENGHSDQNHIGTQYEVSTSQTENSIFDEKPKPTLILHENR